MSREIESTSTYKDVLVKLIPSEIIAAYMFIDGIVPSEELNFQMVLLIVSIILFALIPFYLKKIYVVHNPHQILFTMGTFVVWLYWMGGPFLLWNIHFPEIASIALVLWTLLIPLVNIPTDYTLGQEIHIIEKKPQTIVRENSIVEWNPEMKNYLGRTARIRKIRRKLRVVKINIDSGQHWWAFEWITKINTGEGNDTEDS